MRKIDKNGKIGNFTPQATVRRTKNGYKCKTTWPLDYNVE